MFIHQVGPLATRPAEEPIGVAGEESFAPFPTREAFNQYQIWEDEWRDKIEAENEAWRNSLNIKEALFYHQEQYSWTEWLDRQLSFTLVSSGGEEVSVTAEALRRSRTLRHHIYGLTLEDDNRKIPLVTISHNTLRKLTQWLHKHMDEDLTYVLRIPRSGMPKLPDWDYEFLQNMSRHEILHILEAANSLRIEELVEMCRRR